MLLSEIVFQNVLPGKHVRGIKRQEKKKTESEELTCTGDSNNNKKHSSVSTQTVKGGWHSHSLYHRPKLSWEAVTPWMYSTESTN